jgi:hypothetical protein
MDEDDFRTSLRTAVQQSPEPPSMRVADAIKAGRRAGRRRLATVTAAGAAALAVLTGGAVMAVNHGDGRPSVGGLGPPATSAATSGPSTPSAPADQEQHDATARLLLDKLVSAAPAGWTVTDPADATNLPQNPAAIARVGGWHDGRDVYAYYLNIELKRDGMTKVLVVEVRLPGLIPTGRQGCDLARVYWLAKPSSGCRSVRAGDTDVPVMDNRAASHGEQWSAYRHPDGVVVVVAQLAEATDPGKQHTASPALPLTQQQLAALAMDERFHAIG